MLKRFIIIGITTISFMIISCGDEESSNGNTNIYNHINIKGRSIKGSDEEYTAAKAVAYMNAKKVDEAIECLEKYLEEDPDALSLESLLVTAYFQKSGIDLLTIITKFIKQDYGSVNSIIEGGHYNDIVTIVSKIVEDKELSTTYMLKAETLLKDLEARSTLDQYDRLKKIINNVVLVSLSIINLSDKFSSGFHPEDLEGITEDFAEELIDRLIVAQDVIGQLPGVENLSEEDIGALQEEIDKFVSEMNNEESGETSADRVRKYIEENYNIIIN